MKTSRFYLVQHFLVSCAILLFSMACTEKKVEPPMQKDVPETISIEDSFALEFPYQEEVYVPIYSEIYSKKREYLFHLTATLSIRNTSKADSLFVKKVDYYGTDGNFIRNYQKKTTLVKPFGTLEYIIREQDTLGGSGANFHIIWGANKPIKPIFQAVMVGTFNQQAFSFTTEGVTISEKEQIVSEEK